MQARWAFVAIFGVLLRWMFYPKGTCSHLVFREELARDRAKAVIFGAKRGLNKSSTRLLSCWTERNASEIC